MNGNPINVMIMKEEKPRLSKMRREMWEEKMRPHKTETANTPDRTSVTVLMRSRMLLLWDSAAYSAIFLVTPTLSPREVAMDNT